MKCNTFKFLASDFSTPNDVLSRAVELMGWTDDSILKPRDFLIGLHEARKGTDAKTIENCLSLKKTKNSLFRGASLFYGWFPGMLLTEVEYIGLIDSFATRKIGL